MFVDTGSQVTLVNHSLLQRLGLLKHVRSTGFTLSSFTKDKIPVTGEIPLRVEVAGVTASHTCVVVADLLDSDVLLGTDFLSATKMTLDLSRNILTSPHGTAEFLRNVKSIKQRSNVRVAKTTIVPAHTVMFVNGCLDKRNYSSHCGMLEPFQNLFLRDNVLIANAIVNCKKRMLPVKLINSTDKDIVLYKRKLLGFLNPVDIADDNRHLRNIQVNRISSVEQQTGDAANPVGKDTLPREWTRARLFEELKVDDVCISDELKSKLKDILWDNREAFSTHPNDIGNCNLYKASIELKTGTSPVWTPSRPVAYKLRGEMQKHIQAMLDAGVIGHCPESKFNTPVFITEKPNKPGNYRFLADFRGVNSVCVPDNYELPNVNHVVDKLSKSSWFSSVDMSQSFHQVRFTEESRPMTAFTCNGRRYWYLRMIMGYRNSSAQFSRMMDRLLSNIPIDELCYFLDDILLASTTPESHLDKLDLLLKAIRAAALKLTPSKTELMRKQVTFVGLTISEAGVQVTEDRVKSILNLSPPKTKKQLQKTMGVLGYNRKFVRNFAAIAKPLYALLHKDCKFYWSEACQSSFEELKRSIADSVTLCIPDVEDPLQSFEVTIDASNQGYGATLSQLRDDERRTCAFFSKSVPPHKRVWGATKLEFLAMFHALEYWKIYLMGTKFKVRSDCASLLYLDRIFSEADPNMIRKFHKLAQYNFTIEHISGKSNDVADFLSRHIQLKDPAVAVEHSGIQCSLLTDVPPATRLQPQLTPEGVACPKSYVSAISQEADTCSVADLGIANSDLLLPADLFAVDANQDTDPPQTTVELIISKAKVTDLDTCFCNDKFGKSQKQKQCILSISADDHVPRPEIVDLDLIRKSQGDDQILKEVLSWLNAGERPSTIQALRAPPELVSYWKMFKNLVLRDGIIKRQWLKIDHTGNSTIEKELAVVPLSLQVQTMQLIHSTLISAHPGIEESVRQCMRYFYWPKMKQDFKLFIQSCTICGQNKPPSAYSKPPLLHIVVSEFNVSISIDHIIPERDIVTPRGNRYILSMTDMFSGYLIAVPTRTQESAESYRLILHNWVLKLGMPGEIISDNAPGFTSEFFEQILRAFGCKTTHGTAYTCSSTSKAERSNKRINQALRLVLNDEQMKDWDLYLNYVCFALNSVKSRHTGYSANMVVFGRELNTPLSILVDNENPDLSAVKNKSYQQTIWEHHRMVKDIVSKVRIHAARDYGYADNAFYKHFRPSKPFNAGEYVYTLVNCPSHKFQKRWRGPYKISRVIDDHLCVVELDGGVDKTFNITKLKRYTVSKYSPPGLSDEAGSVVAQDADNVNRDSDHDVELSNGNVLPPVPDNDEDPTRRSARPKKPYIPYQAGFS